MKKIVLIPFGHIEQNKVIHLHNSMRIEISDKSHLVSVSNDTGKIMNDYGQASSNTRSNFKEDNYPGYTAAADASNIKSFKTTWIVPEKPQLDHYAQLILHCTKNSLSVGKFPFSKRPPYIHTPMIPLPVAKQFLYRG